MIRVFDRAMAFMGVVDVVVEVGSIRHPNPRQSGGHSTLQWPKSATVWSCDVNPKATQLTAKMTKDRPGTTALNVDGVEFIRDYDGPPIDVLYLDGPFDKQKAFDLALPKLSPRCVVLIDDTERNADGTFKHPWIGQDTLVPRALSLGFELVEVEDSKQTLLTRAA